VAVRRPDGVSLYRQLLALHVAKREISIEEMKKRLSVQERIVRIKACPRLQAVFSEYESLSLPVPYVRDVLIMDPPIYTFRLGGSLAELDVEVYDDLHPLVAWSQNLLEAFETCPEKLNK
jgi:hypothetical protein